MFIGAIVLNLLSSYFLASIFGNFLIIFIAFFALVVLNMEILSLFSAIKELNVFIFSVANFLVTFAYFKFKNIIPLKFKFDFVRLKNAFLLDKSLVVLLFAFIVLLLVSLFLALVMPVVEPDSQTYHFLRAYEFVAQGSLKHFETNDIRALVMPINSEIVYSWLLLFKKNFHGYGIVSFCAYILALCSMWSVFEEFKFAWRKRIFAIFLFSSFSAVILQIPSLQTDLLVGSLLICAFALFIKNSIYFSSLSLALAMGTKSTGVIAVLAFFVLIIFYEVYIEKNKQLNKTKKFALILPLNFFIFSSYNYFLNLIHFHNPFSNRASYLGHMFWGGFEGYIANLVHFLFQSLDFTGFKWGFYLNPTIFELKRAFFDFIHVNPQMGCNVPQQIVNIFTDEQTVGFGILGFLVFLPTVCVSIFKSCFNKNKKTILVCILAVAFLINMLVLARAVAYMVFSIRFIVAFVCLSAIILVGVYKKRSFLKPIFFIFCLFYMLLIPISNKRMHFKAIYTNLKAANFNLEIFENNYYEGKVAPVLELAPSIYETIIKKYSDKKNIAISKTLISSILYLKKLEYKGYNIDFINPGVLTDKKLKNYDLIVLEGTVQNDNVFNPEDIDKKYHMEGNKIIFDSNKNYNCYYTYSSVSGGGIYLEDAIERSCFTQAYLVQKENLKLDYTKSVDLKEFKENVKLFYFVNQNRD